MWSEMYIGEQHRDGEIIPKLGIHRCGHLYCEFAYLLFNFFEQPLHPFRVTCDLQVIHMCGDDKLEYLA